MSINLESMSNEQLRTLNHSIVAILNGRRQLDTLKKLSKFNIGDRVQFESDSGNVKGVVIRVNKKTISIDAFDPPGQWRVAPSFLKKIEVEQGSDTDQKNLLKFPLN